MQPKRPCVLIALKTGGPELAHILRRQQVDVLIARTGVEAVSYLFPRVTSYAEPNLIVLSAVLPGYNGLSVLAGIRSLGQSTPVVLTWPSAEVWMAHEAVRLRCSALIEEPADLQSLAAEALGVLDQPSSSSCRVGMSSHGTA